ncbi:MAG: ATP-binding protein [Syntrophobacteraceae bacterium]
MNSYEKFMEKLATLPIHSPKTESKIEIVILQKLMTPDQAELACFLSAMPEPAAAIAERAGMETEALRAAIEPLVKKGIIFKVYTEEPLYCLYPLIPGVWEFQLGKLDPQDVKRWESYWEEKLAQDLFTNKTPLIRTVPVTKTIPTEMNVFSYEEVEKLVDEARVITLTDCVCRTSKHMIGEGCDAPVKDSCLALNEWADYYAENGMGRRVSKEKAKEVLAMARDAGLIHNTMNVQQGSQFICNCCGCCCAGLRAITQLNIPTSVAKSNFIAEISTDECTGCGTCVERCQVKALEIVDDVAHLLEERCIGCGVCKTFCPVEAISLKRRDTLSDTPSDLFDLLPKHAAGRTRER